MQVERIRRNSQLFSDGLLEGAISHSKESATTATISISSSQSSFSSSSSSDSPPKANYIQHRVSKMDTLPGVAIKYGVEVEDIKRLNGLVTDIQMFALRTLRIPLPGRHPPSDSRSNASFYNENYSRDRTPPRRSTTNVLDLLNSLKLKTHPNEVSPAMGSLESYYGLRQIKDSPVREGTEMVAYRTSVSYFDDEDELWSTELPISDPFSYQYRKSRASVNGFTTPNGEATEKVILDSAENSDTDKYIRRRQKNDAILPLGSPELLLEDDNGSEFSGRKGKRFAIRPKLGSQTDMATVGPNPPNGDSFMNLGSVSVRKSSSTPSLQESERNSSFLWLTRMWALNPEFLARPLFDGLPNPVTVWKNKAALD